MKRFLQTAALALLVVLSSSLLNKTSAQYEDNYNTRQDVSYQTFYDELSPHGQWIDYPNYGYAWVPDAGPDFRPYSTNGHWVWTDNYEWMWVSDYEWGWGPFHYGRWEEDPYYGWIWIPGYEWSPAWVAWRDGGDYYGWAPLRPGITISIGFNIGNYSPPYSYWCFAPRRYITSPRIYDYYVDRRQNITIINYTTIIVNNSGYNNNYGFRSGPSRYEAERYCGRINPVRFRDSYTPGRTQFRNNEVSVYRPNVRQDNDRRLAPRQFERYDRNNANGTVRNSNRNGNVNNRTNDLPVNRNNNDFRQPRVNNEQTNRTNDNRINRPAERVDRNSNPGNNNNGVRNRPVRQQDVRSNDQPQRQQPQQQPRQFERRQQDVRSNDQPQRQMPPQMERRQAQPRQQDVRSNQPQRHPPQQIEQRQAQQPRQFERRQQDVRSNDQPQRQAPPQVERRQEQRQAPPQMERRQEQRQQPQQQQQQTRQSERRENGNSQQKAAEENNGKGNGRKRF